MKRINVLAMGSLALTSGAWADTVVDLTTNGQTGSIHGAIFSNDDQHAAGTGLIDSFVRVGAANQDQVSGYNTSVRPLGRDEKTDPNFTRDLTLGEVPILSVGGTDYYQFLLDINQVNSAPLLTLDDVQIYINATAQTAYFSTLSGLGALVYTMDGGAGDNNRVELNYSLQEGSGTGDMSMLVPVSAFGGAGASAFVYLYSHFGDPNVNNDGFEEWDVQTPVVVPLPPAGLAGLATLGGLFGFRVTRRRRD